MIKEKILMLAVEHAKDEFPAESAGIFYVRNGRIRYRRCHNIAIDKLDGFTISPREYAEASQAGEIIAIVHSHPNADSEPSVHDVLAHKAGGVDWYIIGLPNGVDGEVKIRHMPAVNDDRPLFGRLFHHPESDCYAFIREWYKKYLNIALPDFYRRENWWRLGDNLYEQHCDEAGFCHVDLSDALQYGDLIVMALQSDVANHGAVFVGDGKIAHHQAGRVSGVDLYKRYYRERTKFVLRHQQASASHSKVTGTPW